MTENQSMRNEWIKLFENTSFPKLMDEDFRSVPLKKLTSNIAYGIKPTRDPAGKKLDGGRSGLLFQNSTLSDHSLPEGFKILKADSEQNILSEAKDRNEADYFALMNLSQNDEPYCINISGCSEEEASIFLGSSDTHEVRHRVDINLNDNAEAKISIHSKGKGFFNNLFRIKLGKNAHLKLSLDYSLSADAAIIENLRADLDSHASLKIDRVSQGCNLGKSGINVYLNAEGADFQLNGVSWLKNELQDHLNTKVFHSHPDCTSSQLVKNILDDEARSSFNGMVTVDQDAQRTSAQQTNKNLLLSEKAVANTKPGLMIFADDVKCAHGATVGQLDKDHIFYLMSRGISEEKALRILCSAFAGEVLGNFSDLNLAKKYREIFK